MQNDQRDLQLALLQIRLAYQNDTPQVRFGRTTQRYLMAQGVTVKWLLAQAMQQLERYSYYRVSQHDHDPRQSGKVFEFLVTTAQPTFYLKFSVSQSVWVYSIHPAQKNTDPSWTRRKW